MNLVITMSRRFGTGASEIAAELSGKLDIPVYDKAYIEHELEGHSYALRRCWYSQVRGGAAERF